LLTADTKWQRSTARGPGNLLPPGVYRINTPLRAKPRMHLFADA
jgi:hypothetical protein